MPSINLYERLLSSCKTTTIPLTRIPLFRLYYATRLTIVSFFKKFSLTKIGKSVCNHNNREVKGFRWIYVYRTLYQSIMYTKIESPIMRVYNNGEDVDYTEQVQEDIRRAEGFMSKTVYADCLIPRIHPMKSILSVAFALVTATSVEASNVSKEYLNCKYQTVVRPVELADSPTSVTTLIQDFGKSAGLSSETITMLEKAVTRNDIESVKNWAASSNLIFWNKDDTTRMIVSQEVLNDGSAFSKYSVEANYTNAIRALLSSLVKWEGSPAAKAKATLPPELLTIVARGMKGEILASDEIDALAVWSKTKLSTSAETSQNGVGLNLTLTVLLDQLPDLKAFKEKVGEVNPAFLIGLLVHSKDTEATNEAKKILQDGLKSKAIDLNMTIFMLAQWEDRVQACMFIETILKEETCLTATQKARLLALLSLCQQIGTMDKYVKEVKLLQEAVSGPPKE